MANEKTGFRLAAYGILAAVLFFGLLRVFIYTNTTSKFFWLELAGLIILLILTFIGFLGFAKGWGENLIFIVFLFYLANLVLIWYFYGSLYLVLLVLAIVGFLLSLPRKKVSPKKISTQKTAASKAAPKKEEPHSMVFDKPAREGEEKKPKYGAKEAISTTELREGGKKPAAKFTPGKYVASRSSNVYHEPKCEWAGKIQKGRQVWFNEKQEAWEKGYKKHDCVK